jgi:hypothetical protein
MQRRARCFLCLATRHCAFLLAGMSLSPTRPPTGSQQTPRWREMDSNHRSPVKDQLVETVLSDFPAEARKRTIGGRRSQPRDLGGDLRRDHTTTASAGYGGRLKTAALLMRDRWFESCPLQQRVRSEPASLCTFPRTASYRLPQRGIRCPRRGGSGHQAVFRPSTFRGARTFRARLPHLAGPAAEGAGAGRHHDDRGGQSLARRDLLAGRGMPPSR